jgi:hypothetical protein
MDVGVYAGRLHRDLWAAGEVGGEETLAVAERLATAMESPIRLVLLDALVEAAGEITEHLSPGSVEVRLLGRDVQFAVTSPPGPSEGAAPPAAAPTPDGAGGSAPSEEGDDGDGGTARLSLRLPERLKPKVEQAAAAAGLSVNAWLVRSITSLVDAPAAAAPPPAMPTNASGQRQTGWAR